MQINSWINCTTHPNTFVTRLVLVKGGIGTGWWSKTMLFLRSFDRFYRYCCFVMGSFWTQRWPPEDFPDLARALTEVKPPSCFNLPMPAMTLSRSLSQSISYGSLDTTSCKCFFGKPRENPQNEYKFNLTAFSSMCPNQSCTIRVVWMPQHKQVHTLKVRFISWGFSSQICTSPWKSEYLKIVEDTLDNILWKCDILWKIIIL